MIKVGQHNKLENKTITGHCAFIQHYIMGFSLYLSSHSVLTQFVFVGQGMARPVSGVDRCSPVSPDLYKYKANLLNVIHLLFTVSH